MSCVSSSLLPSGHPGHHVCPTSGRFDPDRSAQKLPETVYHTGWQGGVTAWRGPGVLWEATQSGFQLKPDAFQCLVQTSISSHSSFQIN